LVAKSAALMLVRNRRMIASARKKPIVAVVWIHEV